MEHTLAEQASLRLVTALLNAAVRRDPEIAEIIRGELRSQYPACRDDTERKSVEFALTIVDLAEQRKTSSLEAPLGAPQPQG